MRFLVLALRDSVAFLSCSVAETQASGRGRAMQYSRRTRRESTVPVFPEFADRGLSGPGTHLKSATTSGPDPEAAARAEGSAGAASSPSSGATPRGGAAEQGAGAGASGSASGAASTPSSAAGEAGVQHRASSGGVFLADSASVRGCRPLPALFNSLTAYFVPCAWAAYGSAEEARSTGVPLLTDGPVSIYLQLCLGSAALDPGSEALEGALQSVAHNMGRPSLPGVGGDEDAGGAAGGEEGEEEAGGRSGRHDARHTAATAHRGRPTHKGAGAATDVVAALSSQYQKDVLLPVFALMLQVMVRAREQEKAVWALLYAVAPHCLRVAEVASHWRSVMVLMSALLHEGLDAASPSPSPASSSASLTRERVPSGSTTSRVERLRRVQAKYSARSACKRGLDVASLAGEDSDETSSRVDSGNSGSFSTSPRQSVTGDKDSAARTGSARAAAAPKGGAVSLEYQCMGLTPQELLVLWDRVAHFAGGGAPHRVHAVVRSASAHREVMLAFEDVMDVLSGCADVAPAKAAAGKRVRSTWSSDRVGVADLRSHAHARYASAELGATTTPALRVVSLEDGAGATNRSSAGGPNTLLAMVGQWLFPAAELPHGTFEVGASVAARALCRLFTRDGSGSIRGPYLARFAAMLHLALTFNNPRAHARAEEEAEEAAKAGGSSLFGAMQKTAAKGGEEEKKAHPAYSLRTWTVLHYSTDLFSRGLRGVGALLPHFLVAIELALADSYRPKLPPALRKAACRLLMRVVCLPQHLRTLPLLTTAHFTGDAFTGRVSGVQGAAAPGEDASSAMRVFQTVQGIVRDSSKGGGAAGEEGSGGGSASAQQPVGTLLLLPFMHALLLRLVETETEPALLAEHLRALTVTAVEVLNHEARQGGVGLAFEASSLLPEAAGSQRGGGSGADHSGEERAVEEALTLQDVLRDPALMHQFRRFCESEFSAENFLFWCEIEEFKRACAASHAQRVEADAEADPEALTPALERVAKRIFNRYVASSAVMMVNLPSSCAREIKVAMTRGNVRASVFDRAQGEIHFLMEKDTLRRFLNVLRSARQRIPAATVGALGGHAAAANPEISVAAIESLRSLCEFAPQLVSASPELPREIVLVLAHCVESASQAMHKQAPSPTAEAAEAGEGDQGHSAFSMLFGSNGTRAATPRHGAGIRRRLSTFVCEIPSAAVAVSAITTAVEWLLRGVRAPSGTEWDKQGQPCNLLDDSEVSAAVFGALQTALSECGALTSGRATGAGAGGDSSSTRGASLHSVAAAARTAIMQLLHRHNAFPGDTGPQQVCSLVTEEDALYRAMSHGAHASGAPVPPDGDAAGESGEKPARQVMGHVKGAVTSREQEVFCPFNTAPLVLAFHGRLLSLVEGECRDPAAALHQRGRRVLRVILRDAVGKHCWQYELPEAEARTGMESLWQQLVPKGGEGEQAGDAGWVSLQAHDVVPTPAGTEEPVLEPPSCPEAYSGSKAAQDDVSEAPTEERWRALVAGGAVEATASPSAEPADRSPAADEGQDSGEGAGVTAPAGTPIKWHRARRRMHGSVVQGTNHAVVPRLAPSSDRLSDLIHFLQREFALEVPPLSPPAELKGQAGTTLQRMCAACESQHDQEQRYAEARTGRMPGWRFHRESLPAPPGALTSRDLTRMLLSHLGLISEKGLRGMKRLSMAATSVAALKALDAAPARETTVCAVFYAPRVPGASSASQRAGAAIGRRHGPEEYRRLLQGLGWRVEAKQHGALGGHTAGVTVGALGFLPPPSAACACADPALSSFIAGHIVYHGTATTEAAFLDAPGLMREAEAEDAAGNTAVSGGAGGDESPKRASRSASKVTVRPLQRPDPVTGANSRADARAPQLSRLRAAPVHVVFCEGGVPEEDDYSPLGGPNTLVTLCIHPLPRFEDAGSAHTPKRAAAEPADRDHLYRVRIHTRSPGGGTRGVSHFGPLLDGMTVSRALLGPLIREVRVAALHGGVACASPSIADPALLCPRRRRRRTRIALRPCATTSRSMSPGSWPLTRCPVSTLRTYLRWSWCGSCYRRTSSSVWVLATAGLPPRGVGAGMTLSTEAAGVPGGAGGRPDPRGINNEALSAEKKNLEPLQF